MKPAYFILTFLNITACAQKNHQPKPNIGNRMEQKNPEEEKAVIAVVNKLSELMMAKDLRGMEEILDQNFTLTHMTGYQQ